MTESEWLTKYLAPLAGATIKSVEIKADDDGYWPTLHVKTKEGDGLTLEVPQDEEGNGPGFIFGLPMPR